MGCLSPHGTHCHASQVDRWGVYLHMEPIAMLLRWIGCLPPHGTHCHVFQVDRWGVYLHMEPIAMLVSPASELVEKELAGDGPTGVMVNPLRVKRKECKVLL